MNAACTRLLASCGSWLEGRWQAGDLAPGHARRSNRAPAGQTPAAQISPICKAAGLPDLDYTAVHDGGTAREPAVLA